MAGSDLANKDVASDVGFCLKDNTTKRRKVLGDSTNQEALPQRIRFSTIYGGVRLTIPHSMHEETVLESIMTPSYEKQ